MTTWQDAGGRREAFFTNLPPGRYRFHVIASNDDDVWNRAGASLAFTIAPAWNQTWWFLGLVALTLVATPALAAVGWQRRRAHLAAERAQARFEAMLAERTRVARELHDTLLGSMAGVVLQLDAGARRLAAGDSNTAAVANLLSTLGSQAREALTKTRQSVVAMRTSPDAQLLHEQLEGAAQRTFSGTEIVVHLTQTGTARPYPPAVEAEIVEHRRRGDGKCAAPLRVSVCLGHQRLCAQRAARSRARRRTGVRPLAGAADGTLGPDRHAGAGGVGRRAAHRYERAGCWHRSGSRSA